MKIERRFLRSKVARRIFILFLSCAVLPIFVLSLGSAGFVTHELDSQARDRLHSEAKTIGMEVLGRLDALETELRVMATLVDIGTGIEVPGNGADFIEHLSGRFATIAIVTRSGGEQAILGTVDPLPGIPAVAFERSADGEAHLWNRLADDGEPRIFLATPLAGGAAARLLVGEIDPGFLWGAQQGGGLPANTELIVVNDVGEALFGSLDRESWPTAQQLRDVAGMASGEFTWDGGKGAYLARHWSLFLLPRYGSPNWTVVLGRSQADILAPLARYGRLLPMVALLCLLVVVLLSFVQIRRSLVPLERLREGTRQIAERQFDTSVVVDSGDEFELLARSFNDMAGQIGRQFNSLSTVSEIHRAILSTFEEDEIIQTLLARLPSHFRCQCVAVTAVDTESESARFYVRWADDPQRTDLRTATLTHTEKGMLTSAGSGTLALELDEIPDHLQESFTDRIEWGLVLPVVLEDELAGCLTLGYDRPPELDEDDLGEARRLADQMAVAFSKARLVARLERTNWETLRALARAVDANSSWTPRAGSRRGRADGHPQGRAAARHREDRSSQRGPGQAGPSHAGRAGVDAATHDDRRAHSRADVGLRPRDPDCPLPPRAVRRQRLPRGPGGRGDPVARQDPGRGRRLRCAGLRATVPSGMAAGSRGALHPVGGGHALRPESRRGVSADRGRGTGRAARRGAVSRLGDDMIGGGHAVGRCAAPMLGLVLAAACLACGGGKTTIEIPRGMSGTYVTSDPRYADRYFRLSDSELVLGLGEHGERRHAIRSVELDWKEQRALYTIEYLGEQDRERLRFFYERKGNGQIYLENQPTIRWTKERQSP
jgi:HAMP domain-containing protein